MIVCGHGPQQIASPTQAVIEHLWAHSETNGSVNRTEMSVIARAFRPVAISSKGTDTIYSQEIATPAYAGSQ